MWESEPLKTLWAFTACYRDNFTLRIHSRLLQVQEIGYSLLEERISFYHIAKTKGNLLTRRLLTIMRQMEGRNTTEQKNHLRFLQTKLQSSEISLDKRILRKVLMDTQEYWEAPIVAQVLRTAVKQWFIRRWRNFVLHVGKTSNMTSYRCIILYFK
jgi:hypothetical protein